MVHLYVTHGILSKGSVINGVDRIFTTTSYRDREEYHDVITVFDVLPAARTPMENVRVMG